MISQIQTLVSRHCPLGTESDVAARTIAQLMDDPHAVGPGFVESLHLQVRLLVGDEVGDALIEWIVQELLDQFRLVDRTRIGFAANKSTGNKSRKTNDALAELASHYPWPSEPPTHVACNEDTHFFTPGSADLLNHAMRELNPQLIVEVGAWLGASTRFLLRSCAARVITIDTWLGSQEHQAGSAWMSRHPAHGDVLNHLPETFIKNCWEYRERLIRLRTTSLNGFYQIASVGLKPDLIFLDGAHDGHSVAAELELAHRLFPESRIVLDDYNPTEKWLEGLVIAANRFADMHGFEIITAGGNACMFAM